jgi:hypothetical protein
LADKEALAALAVIPELQVIDIAVMCIMQNITIFWLLLKELLAHLDPLDLVDKAVCSIQNACMTLCLTNKKDLLTIQKRTLKNN